MPVDFRLDQLTLRHHQYLLIELGGHLADGGLAAEHRCFVKIGIVGNKLHPRAVGDHLDGRNQTASGGSDLRMEVAGVEPVRC